MNLPVRVRVRRKYRKLQRFSRLPVTDRILTFEAAVFLAIARTWLLVVPFRKIAATLGTSHPASVPRNVPAPTSERDDEISRRISEARCQEYPRSRSLHPAGDCREADAAAARDSMHHALRRRSRPS